MSTILIVEDDKAVSNLIYLNLTVAGYNSKQAFTGSEAVNAIDTVDFDLIILDIMLPDMDGFIFMEKSAIKVYRLFS